LLDLVIRFPFKFHRLGKHPRFYIQFQLQLALQERNETYQIEEVEPDLTLKEKDGTERYFNEIKK